LLWAELATNAFVSLGETVIMVQRPHLNLPAFVDQPARSVCRATVVEFPPFWTRFLGAAVGILVPYVVQGIPALCHPAVGISLERFLGATFAPPLDRRRIAIVSALICPGFLSGVCRNKSPAAAVSWHSSGFSGGSTMPHRKGQAGFSAGAEDGPRRLSKKMHRFVCLL